MAVAPTGGVTEAPSGRERDLRDSSNAVRVGRKQPREAGDRHDHPVLGALLVRAQMVPRATPARCGHDLVPRERMDRACSSAARDAPRPSTDRWKATPSTLEGVKAC